MRPENVDIPGHDAVGWLPGYLQKELSRNIEVRITLGQF